MWLTTTINQCFFSAHHDAYGHHDSRGSHAGVRYIGLQSWDSVDSLESLSFL